MYVLLPMLWNRWIVRVKSNLPVSNSAVQLTKIRWGKWHFWHVPPALWLTDSYNTVTDISHVLTPFSHILDAKYVCVNTGQRERAKFLGICPAHSLIIKSAVQYETIQEAWSYSWSLSSSDCDFKNDSCWLASKTSLKKGKAHMFGSIYVDCPYVHNTLYCISFQPIEPLCHSPS